MQLLGQDDWLFYARRDDGTLVYTVTEIDPCRWNAPNGGYADYGTAEWRVDNGFAHLYVQEHMNSYTWHVCYLDTDGTRLDWPPSDDDDFISRSRKTYLPD